MDKCNKIKYIRKDEFYRKMTELDKRVIKRFYITAFNTKILLKLLKNNFKTSFKR